MHFRNDRLDRLRAEQSDIGNHVIDEFVAGHISRRGFLRAGALVGISAPVLGGVLAACGSSTAPSTTPSSGSAASGATIKAGIVTPAAAINPVTVADQGGLDMLGQRADVVPVGVGHERGHPLATLQQPVRHMPTDKSRGACYQGRFHLT